MAQQVFDQVPFKEYTANGVTTVFAYDFQVLEAADMVVYKDGVLVPASEYVLAGLGVPAGGTVTFLVAPANGVKVLLNREIALQRLTEYQTLGDFKAVVVNPDFNRLWQALQGFSARIGGALRLPYPEQAAALPAPAARANKLLSFDAAGVPQLVAPSAQSAAALALDLATSNDATKGAGQIGLNTALAYAANTVGKWIKDAVSSIGSSLIGWIQAGIGAVAGTVQDKLRESVSALDFMSAAKKADVIARTYLLDVTAEVQAAIDAVSAAGGGVLALPFGGYRISGTLTLATNVRIDLRGSTVRQYTNNIPVFSAPAGVDIQQWGLHGGTLEFNTQQTSVQTLGVGVRLANTKLSYIWFIRDLKVDKACDGIFSPNTAGTFAFVGEITNFVATRAAGWAINMDCDAAAGANTNVICTNCWALQTAGAEIATSKGFRFRAMSMGRWDSLFADHIQSDFGYFESCSGQWGELTAESCDWVANAITLQLLVFSDCYGAIDTLKWVANNLTASGGGAIYMVRPTGSGADFALFIRNFVSAGNAYTGGANIYEVNPAAVRLTNELAKLDRAVNLADFGVVKLIQRWNGADRRVSRGTTAQRPVPSADDLGMRYLDNTLAANGKPIFWNGAAWVDGLGAVV